MVLLRFCIKGIATVSTMILARLLMPEDFGLMALASSIYAMIELIRAFGFDTALIQNQKAGRDHYDTAWTMQVIFSLLASSALITVSDIAASYYSDPRLAGVLRMMAFIIMLNGFNNIGVVEFRKKLTFNKEFLYQILIKLSGFCVTIPLAWYWRSYWALLMGMLSGTIASLLLGYIMQNYRPRLTLIAWRDLLKFSSWLFLNNILYFLNQHTQNFILAKFGGSGALGLLSVANEVATITTTEIVASINRAAYPGYSKFGDDKEKLKESYLGVLSYIILIALPSAIGIAAIAPIFVPVLLGEKWLNAVPIIQVIALASAMTALNTNSAYIYLVLAKQKITTILMFFWLALFIPLLIRWVPSMGALGTAYAMLVSSAIMFPVNQFLIKRQLNVSWSNFNSIIYRPLFSSIIMGFAVHRLVVSFGLQVLNMEGICWLLFSVLSGVVCFVIAILMLWMLAGRPDGPEQWIIARVLRRFKLSVI